MLRRPALGRRRCGRSADAHRHSRIPMPIWDTQADSSRHPEHLHLSIQVVRASVGSYLAEAAAAIFSPKNENEPDWGSSSFSGRAPLADPCQLHATESAVSLAAPLDGCDWSVAGRRSSRVADRTRPVHSTSNLDQPQFRAPSTSIVPVK